jgi:redox-sensing transcriptional repressor
MNITEDFILRLLKYKNILTRLKKLGIVKVFSDNLGDATGLMASQVRKDFSTLEIAGNKRGGYHIDNLIEKLSEVLGKDEVQKVVVVGCGHIGQAIMAYRGFSNENLKIVAGFDIDKTKMSGGEHVPVHPIEQLDEFVKKHKIKVGIIAVPESAAPDVYEKMVAAGVKGVLNFARVYLRKAHGVIVNTVNIELQIENLFYFVNQLEGKVNKDTPEGKNRKAAK